jgi:hypothetical protein
MNVVQQTTVTISYTCTDGKTWTTPEEAQEHQRLLNIAEVLKAHGIVSKQMEDICKAICDGWPGLEEAVRPAAIIASPAPMESRSNAVFMPEFHGVELVLEPVPMKCVNVAAGMRAASTTCNCPPCQFNRSIKRTCPTCKAQKLVLNGQIWQCTGCGDIEQ